MKSFLCFLFGLLLIQFSFSQDKYEREVRKNQRDIPQKAVDFINTLNFSSKIKWYKEYGLNSTSFEAKTKFKGKKYSIEFDSIGNLEDAEIIISEKQIEEVVLSKIKSKLKTDKKKFKLGKIQIQYSGSKESVKQKIIKNQNNENLIIRYEIIVTAKVNKKFQKFEYLFSHLGEFIQRKTIVLANTDNLEY